MNPPSETPPAPGAEAASPPPRPSLIARLFNILAAPGEVFEQVRAEPPRTAHWLVPALLLLGVGGLGAWLIFRQPAFRQQQDEIQLRVLARMVEKGKLPRAQFEQLQQNLGGGGPAKYLLGPAIGVLGFALVSPFWGAFWVWLIGAKMHRGGFSYAKALDVAGLANMVVVLGSLVKTLMILALGNLQAAPTPALLVREFDPFNPLHAALGMFDLFGFWVCGVRAAGMAALGGPAWGRGFAWLVLIWAGLNGLMVLVVWAARAALGL